MKYRSFIGNVLLILMVLVLFSVSACTPDDQPQDTGTEGNGDTPILNGDGETESPDETISAGDSPIPEPAGDPVTQEDLEALTEFGPFMFPESILDESTSVHSNLSDGTDQYLLYFVCEVPIETVADWYTDNLEPETTQNSLDTGDGNMIYTFEFNSVEAGLVKRFFMLGEAGGPGCEIRVNIYIQSERPSMSDTDEAESE